jgi:hypothetical protein
VYVRTCVDAKAHLVASSRALYWQLSLSSRKIMLISMVYCWGKSNRYRGPT